MSRAKDGGSRALGRRLRGMVGTGADSSAFEEERDEGDHDDLKLAGFFVGGALYGIDIMRIKEVVRIPFVPCRMLRPSSKA